MSSSCQGILPEISVRGGEIDILHSKSNKELKDDYLVVSGEWHDGLCCPIMVGTPGRVF